MFRRDIVILSCSFKNADTDTHPTIHQVMKIVLTDENYQPALNYTLDFDVIGKIDIYRNAK